MCPYLDLLLGFRDSSERCCISKTINQRTNDLQLPLIYRLGNFRERTCRVDIQLRFCSRDEHPDMDPEDRPNPS